MVQRRIYDLGVLVVALLAFAGEARTCPFDPLFRTEHSVIPDQIRHSLDGRCGQTPVELSWETSRTRPEIAFSDLRIGGAPIEGSAAVLSAMLGSDYLQNVTLIRCSGGDASPPVPKLMMTILKVDRPFGTERLEIRTFEIVDGKIEPR